MENEYSFVKSLENIESILSSLPPTTEILSKWQALRLFQQAMDEYVTHEKLQKSVIPNFNITEIHLFPFQFIRFYMFNAPCICHHSLCDPVEFEPRYGCTNCTKLLKESSDIEKLCLLCQTYQMITGTSRPSNHVNFTDEERKLISAWKAKEKELNKFMDREVFEKLCNDEKIQRWKDLKLTDEENIMLGFQNSRTRTSYAKKTDAQKRTWLLENLQPFVLPIFIDCKCSNSADRKALMKKQQLCLPKIYGPRVVRFAEDFNPWLDLSTE
ncbi:hypothetical protein CRE_08403 [Caenorhabditis remanei]|uniref:ELM2 domain-containing protein n=1 Tax=Caenorhabditis remanei TaxID=31234 RepID=E3MPJ5_CAERE|nr:hypothetical protein CRE_08403 [Caenorhabditis remanei]